MKKKDTGKLIAILLLIILFTIGAFTYVSIENKNKESYSVMLFFYDPIPRELVPLNMKIEGTPEVVTKKIFEYLKSPPDINYFPTIGHELSLGYAKFSNGTLTINILSHNTKKSEKEAYITFLSLANSLKSIKGVEHLNVLMDGEKKTTFLGYVSIEDTLNNLTSTLPKFKMENLYFLTPDCKYLAVEKREMKIEDSPLIFAKKVLDELSCGSHIGLISLLKEDMIRSIEIKSGGIAVVDFTERINDVSMGSNTAQLFVGSIVNSLTEIREINSVSFEVEGKPVDTLFGVVDTGAPLLRFNRPLGTHFLIPYYVKDVNGNKVFVPVPTEEKEVNLNALIALLQSPPPGLYSDIKDVSFTMLKKEGDTLKAEIKRKSVLSADAIENIKEEVLFSFTEIEGINKIELFIGEEVFLLSR